MATLTPQLASPLGIAANLVSCAPGGDSFPVIGVTLVVIRNADSSSHVVTMVRPGTTYGTADPDVPITVAAGATEVIGPIPGDWVNTSTGYVDMTYGAVLSQTVAVIRAL